MKWFETISTKVDGLRESHRWCCCWFVFVIETRDRFQESARGLLCASLGGGGGGAGIVSPIP